MRRRYRIEAYVRTLSSLLERLAKSEFPNNTFVQSVRCSVDEDYYYVVVIADQDTHKMLNDAGFKDSIALKN